MKEMALKEFHILRMKTNMVYILPSLDKDIYIYKIKQNNKINIPYYLILQLPFVFFNLFSLISFLCANT